MLTALPSVIFGKPEADKDSPPRAQRQGPASRGQLTLDAFPCVQLSYGRQQTFCIRRNAQQAGYAKPLKSHPSKERCSGLFGLSGLEIPNDAHLKFVTHR
jgi:hypothetical protein